MKDCELCDQAARMYCESDQASLCWDCDAKVHGANFLVARHVRVLLCRRCQAPTPWSASGARLCPTVTACERCAAIGKVVPDGEEEDEDEDDNDGDESDVEEEEEEEEGDYQVVPWTMTPPPPASSSSGEESSSPSPWKESAGFLRRVRDEADHGSEVEENNCIKIIQSDPSLPFSQRSHLDRSMRAQTAQFPAQSIAEEGFIAISDSFSSSKNCRRSFLRPDAPPSAASAGTRSRVCAGRGSTAVDPVSPASCSPPS